MQADSPPRADYSCWRLGKYRRVLIDLGPFYGASFEAASRKLFRVLTVVFPNAEDVAQGDDWRKEFHVAQRDARFFLRDTRFDFVVSLNQSEHVADSRVQRDDTRSGYVDNADSTAPIFYKTS